MRRGAHSRTGRVQEGEPVVEEGWERIYIGGMIASFITIVVGLWAQPETDLQTWAREEVLARDGPGKYAFDDL